MKLTNLLSTPPVVHVTYCTNYNGAYIKVNGAEVDHDQLTDAICNALINDCDEDGEFQGSETKANATITALVKQAYGNAVVEVEFDDLSS